VPRTHQHRDQALGHHGPGAGQELRLVKRCRADRAVRPALAVGGVNAHEQRDALILAAPGSPKRRDERQAHDPQFDGLDLHGLAFALPRTYQPGSITPVRSRR